MATSAVTPVGAFAGPSAAEMVAQVAPLLTADLRPNGGKVGRWQKTAQLDLEARGPLERGTGARPLRWHRTRVAAVSERIRSVAE